MKKTFMVAVEFPAKHAFGPVEQAIKKVFGKNEMGSGMGFGIRDMDAEYKTEKAAMAAAEKVKAILKGAKIGTRNFDVRVSELED